MKWYPPLNQDSTYWRLGTQHPQFRQLANACILEGQLSPFGKPGSPVLYCPLQLPGVGHLSLSPGKPGTQSSASKEENETGRYEALGAGGGRCAPWLLGEGELRAG